MQKLQTQVFLRLAGPRSISRVCAKGILLDASFIFSTIFLPSCPQYHPPSDYFCSYFHLVGARFCSANIPEPIYAKLLLRSGPEEGRKKRPAISQAQGSW